MRFLIDMGLGAGVAAWLRSRGHDAVHLREEGLQRLSDERILAKAAEEGRTILTTDLDFAELVALSKGGTVSVVVFRVSHPRTHRIIERLEVVLAHSRLVLESGAVVSVEDARHRIRPLPVGRDG